MVRIAKLIASFLKRLNSLAVAGLNLKIRKIWVMMLIIFALNACSSPKPPTEFAPDGETIQKAILLQLNQTEQRLSQQLNAVHPELAISQIKVKTLDPVYVAELPAYHLQGSYTLKLTLPRQQVTQKNNRFDIYLQRQTEGKTWRLLRRDLNPVSQEPQWSSYFVGSWEQETEN